MKKQRFELFAAANGADGFTDAFADVFDRRTLEKIFILHGTPGCGKSTLMKKCAALAEARMYDVLYIYCSSDARSLDGIIVPQKHIAVLDGTPPHAFPVLTPFAKETVIDLSSCIDGDAVFAERSAVLAVGRAKKACYDEAYRLLRIAGECVKDVQQTARHCLKPTDISKEARAFVNKYLTRNTDNFCAVSCSFSANATNGETRLFSCEKMCQTNVFIDDCYHTAHLFFDAVAYFAEQRGISYIRGRNPLLTEQTALLCFPHDGVCLSLYDEKFAENHKHERILHMKRFFDKDALSQRKNALRFSEKCASAAHRHALKMLCDAGKYHEKTESLYGSAADFDKTEKIAAPLLHAFS